MPNLEENYRFFRWLIEVVHQLKLFSPIYTGKNETLIPKRRGKKKTKETLKIKCELLTTAPMFSFCTSWESIGSVIIISCCCTAFGRTRFLGQQEIVNVGHHTAVGNSDRPEQFAELFVVSHRQLNMARHNTGFLVVSRCVPSQFQNL